MENKSTKNNYKAELQEYLLILKDEQNKSMTLDQLFNCIEHIAWCYYNVEEYNSAIDYYSKALELMAGDYEVTFMLSTCYYQLGNFIKALEWCKKTLKCKKAKYSNVFLQMGNIHSAMTNFHEANKFYKMAIELTKDRRLYHNISKNHLQAGDYEKAEYFQKKANKAEVVDATLKTSSKRVTKFLLSDIKLHQKNYQEGWMLYEERDEAIKDTSKHEIPYWNGEDLTNKKLIVFCEQGYGDTLQFIRFVNKIKCNEITVVSQKKLSKLLQTGINAEVIEDRPVDIKIYDYQCMLLSLPHILKIHSDDDITSFPYLFVEPEDAEKFEKRMGDKLRVGILFAGESRKDIALKILDDRRSMKLSHYEDILKLDNAEFYNVTLSTNKPEIKKQIDEYKLTDFSDELTDWYETACLVSCLDLVIGVDTSTIHLAGALGVETLLLSRKDGCWRWGPYNLSTTSWYSGMTILRQEQFNDWTHPLNTTLGILRLK